MHLATGAAISHAAVLIKEKKRGHAAGVQAVLMITCKQHSAD